MSVLDSERSEEGESRSYILEEFRVSYLSLASVHEKKAQDRS